MTYNVVIKIMDFVFYELSLINNLVIYLLLIIIMHDHITLTG